ncbi:MAG: Stp1/IreP family PP2C-type Ser/Thr phosphatase [Burkholderiales bacterium]|nr:Stp1/IreP family PP2C-type Ser/Thr phosphatase [Burkholderiales bacterium]MDR4516987.1 Stp1/IreP family PP2C-type Ser/Thr phosphatase [Nitrosomonas sp.]
MLAELWERFLRNVPRFTKITGHTPVDYQMEIGLLTDKGLTRSINQDNIGVFQLPDGQGCIAIVADGMGGHQAGEIASRTAVETIQQNYFRLDKHAPDQALSRVFDMANCAIYTQAQDDPKHHGMGTTLVVLALHKSMAYFAHTGDSRLYYMHENGLHQLTQDHTLVAEMLQQGLIDAEQAKNHPEKHIITHAVGTERKVFVELPYTPLPIKIGDCFLLCSDGLYDLVDDTEILDISMKYPAQQACEELVRLANERGGHDNISVIIIRIVQETEANLRTPITRV